MSDDLVSIIIPTFNRISLIGRAIDSVLRQTHQRIEVIVVNDGSTDGTGVLIERRYGADPRVRCLTQTNQGVSAARNRGLAAARGEYVALLDSDDIWKPWKLELQVACFRAVPQIGMVWTDMEAIDPDGNIVSGSYLQTMYQRSYRWFPDRFRIFSDSRAIADIGSVAGVPGSAARLHWGDIYSPMIMGNLVHTSTVVLRRERLERVRGFNEALRISGEDYDFHLRTCREGPVAFADISSIQYQIGRADQLSHHQHAIHMARNFLSTIGPAIDKDRNRIRLPAHMISAVQAFAHGWVGIEHLNLGERAKARSFLRRSLHFRLWQPAIWIFYGLALLPSAAARLAIRMLRGAKRNIRTLVGR